MKLTSITSEEFKEYGYAVQGYDYAPLISMVEATTEKPTDHVIYIPSDAQLENLPILADFTDSLYGGMPIQIGYCNGFNTNLNCLEYHRGSELNVACDDVILLLARLSEMEDGKLDTNKVRAFLLPKGAAVLLYENTLHYAPCVAPDSDAFRVVVVLPRRTNTDKPDIQNKTQEDRLLWARNKWLIAHPDTDEARSGAYVGLVGENLTVR